MRGRIVSPAPVGGILHGVTELGGDPGNFSEELSLSERLGSPPCVMNRCGHGLATRLPLARLRPYDGQRWRSAAQS